MEQPGCGVERSGRGVKQHRAPASRRWLGGLLAVLAVLTVNLLLAAPASAHTVLVASDPADGSRLAQSPAVVKLRFNEQVGLELGYLRVVDSSGHRVDTGQASHPDGAGDTVSVTLRSGLGDGSYLASYRVISADSHPVAGTVRYVVGAGPLSIGGGTSDSAPVDQAVSTALSTSHWLSFAGVAMAGGSWLVFTLWPAGRRRLGVRRLVWGGWGLAALGAVTEYLLQGPYAAGSGLDTLARTGLLDATLHNSTGQLLSLRVLLLGVLGLEFGTLLGRLDRPEDDPESRPSWAPEAAAIVGAGIVVTFAASGHTRSANPRWLWILLDGLHLSSMIVWLGGVLVLAVAAFGSRRRDLSDLDDGADPAADRVQLAAGVPVFSRIAMACIATLAVTGTLQAWRDVGAWDALATTRYGQLVLIKVALFCAILGLGYLARRAVLRSSRPHRTSGPEPALDPAGSGVGPGAGSGVGSGTLAGAAAATTTVLPARLATPAEPGLPERLRRTLLVEVVVGALVLAATAVLVSQPPGKAALAAERSKPRQATVRVSAATEATVEVTPGVHGNVRFAVRLAGGAAPTTVTATASLPAQQLGPIPVPLTASGPGSYTSAVVTLPVAGTWQLSLTVQTSEFDSTVAVARVRVY